MLKPPRTPAEEEAWREPYQCIQTPDKGKTQTGSLEWYPVTDLQLLQCTQTETQEVSAKHQQSLFHCESGWAVAQVALRCYCLPPWRYSKAAWACLSCNWPCLSRGIGQMPSRGPFQPQAFCEYQASPLKYMLPPETSVISGDFYFLRAAVLTFVWLFRFSKWSRNSSPQD